MTLGDVMHRFKTWTTERYADGVREAEWPPFGRRLWQRNYHEHVIRDAGALQRIRTYIEQNPLRWRTDGQHPLRGASFDDRRVEATAEHIALRAGMLPAMWAGPSQLRNLRIATRSTGRLAARYNRHDATS